MRIYYLVSYDITDQKRWNKVYKIMLGFGQRLQYSVFICELTPIDVVKLEMKLRGVIKHDEDKIMLIELGKDADKIEEKITWLGVHTPLPKREPIIV
ncbi:MAG: CRISPR-associated endonuclease Cas2 [Thermoplasmata archaeon]